MSDLLVGFALVLVFEGLLWALAPGFGRQALAMAAATPEARLRAVGAVAIGLGVAIVWLVRG